MKTFPIGRDAQEAGVLRMILHSTRGMARPGVASMVAERVFEILDTVEIAQELAHMLWLTDLLTLGERSTS